MADERKAIFITGGASGIGLATAKLFANRGWTVGIADIDAETLAAAGAAVFGSVTYQMDVRDRDAWMRTLDDFTTLTRRLDVLFNNAGIGVGGPLAEADFADLDRVVAINFVGVLNGARIGYAYLAKTPGSCLLNTASASAIYGSAGLATYSATKFAVRALTEALDGEWAAAGIKVRAIVPERDRLNGWLPVPGWTGRHEWRGFIPWERMPRQVDPEDGLLVTANNRIAADGHGLGGCPRRHAQRQTGSDPCDLAQPCLQCPCVH